MNEPFGSSEDTETTPEFLIPLSRGKVKRFRVLETKRSRCTRVAGGKACGTNGVRIESKENPSKRAGANGKGMLAGRFDIITDALTNARVRRQENAKVGKSQGRPTKHGCRGGERLDRGKLVLKKIKNTNLVHRKREVYVYTHGCVTLAAGRLLTDRKKTQPLCFHLPVRERCGLACISKRYSYSVFILCKLEGNIRISRTYPFFFSIIFFYVQ